MSAIDILRLGERFLKVGFCWSLYYLYNCFHWDIIAAGMSGNWNGNLVPPSLFQKRSREGGKKGRDLKKHEGDNMEK